MFSLFLRVQWGVGAGESSEKKASKTPAICIPLHLLAEFLLNRENKLHQRKSKKVSMSVHKKTS